MSSNPSEINSKSCEISTFIYQIIPNIGKIAADGIEIKTNVAEIYILYRKMTSNPYFTVKPSG
jgi:hypothetical protein